jgi:hypothetical protein
VVKLSREEVGEELVPGKAVLGQGDRRSEDIGERQCAEFRERDGQRVNYRRDRSR